jgi:hypothetical protein
MKKKIIAVVLALLLLLSFTGCEFKTEETFVELEFIECGKIDGLLSSTYIYTMILKQKLCMR